VFHLISLLADEMAPGLGYSRADGTERPSETVVESGAWKRYALQAISLWGVHFLPVDLLPVDLIEVTARSCRPAAIARIEDG
jgi:hypothetical protein